MAESYSVTAILSAQDKNFSSVFGSAQGAADSLAGKLKSGLGFGAMMGIGQAAVNAVAGSLKGLVGGVIETGKSFETASSQIAATMGKSKSEIADITKKAAELGRTTKFTATEAAEGFNILAMSGLEAKEQIAAMPTVLDLASAGAESLDAAASQVVGTLKGFGKEVTGATNGIDNARYVSDLLAKGATLAATDVNGLGTALSTSAATSKGYGQSIQSTEVALLRLAEQNVTGAEAATALSRAMADVYTATPKAEEALKKLGVNAYDPTTGKAKDFNVVVDEVSAALAGMSDAEANAAKNAIFSTYGLRAFNMMASTGTEKWKKFSEELESASDGMGSAASQAKEQMNNLQGDLDYFGSATEGLSNAIYGNMNVPMRAFVKVATAGITEVTGAVEKFGNFLSSGIDLGRLQDAIDENGIAGAVSVLSESLSGMIPGFQGVAVAAGAIGTVSLANTVLDSGVWKAGIAGVRTFDDVVRTLPGAMAKDFGKAKKSVQDFGYGILNTTSKTFPQLLTGLSGIGDKAAAPFAKMGAAAKTAWSSMTSDSVLGKITGFAGKVGGALGKVTGVVTGVAGKLAGSLQSMMGLALKALMPAAMVGAALAGLGLLQERFGDQINGILSMVREKAPEIISNFASGISSRVPELVSQGAALVSNLLNTFAAVAPSAVSAGVQIISSLVSGVAQSAPQLITSAVSAVGSFASSVISALPSLITTGMQLLLGLATGIAQNLPRMAQGAAQAVQGFAQGFSQNLPAILTTAGQIVITLIQGITQALPQLTTGAVGIIGTLASGFIQNLPLIIQTGVQVVVALASGLLSAVGTLISSIPTIFGQVKDAIINTDWLSVGAQIIEAIGSGILGGAAAVGGKVGEFFGGIGEWIIGGKKAGEQYAKGCAAAIAEKEPEITAASSTTAAQVAVNLEDIFGNSGAQGGAGLVSGLAESMQSLSPAAVSAAESMASDVTGALASGDLESGASDAGQQGVESLASSIESGASAVENAATSTVANAVSAFQSGASDMLSAGTDMASAVVDGFAKGVEPIGETAQQAVEGAASSMQGGISALQGAGTQAGSSFTTGVRAGLAQAPAVARASVSAVTAVLKSLASSASAAGKNAGSKFAAAIKSTSGAAKSAGTAIGNSAASALRAVAGSARSAGSHVGSSAVSGMRSQSSSARSAGSSLGSSFTSGVSSKSGSARSAGSSLANAAKSGASGHSLYSVGADLAQGFVNGIASKIGAARSKAAELERVAERVIAAKAKIGSPSKVLKQFGAWFAEGFAIGIESGERSVRISSAGIADAAIEGIRDEAEIHSPSKKAELAGFYMGQGLANGISAAKGIAVEAAKTVIGAVALAARSSISGWDSASDKTMAALYLPWEKDDFLRKAAVYSGAFGGYAQKTMNAYKQSMLDAAKNGNFKAVATTIAKKMKTSMTAKSKNLLDSASGTISSAVAKMSDDAKKKAENYKQLAKAAEEAAKKAKKNKDSTKKAEYEKQAKAYEDLAKTYEKQASSISKSSSVIKSAFTTAFNSQTNAAIKSVQDSITKLGETYQKKYDAIIKAQTSFRDRLREVSLGTEVENGNTGKNDIVLTDYGMYAARVEQYGKNLEKLKKTMPSSLMDEILEMDMEDGTRYAEKLLSMSLKEQKAYAKAYTKYQSATASVASTYYKQQVDAVKSNYTSAVEAEFKKLQTSLGSIGKDVMQGFADGMKSKKKALDNTGKALADSLVKTLKAKLKINSPSRVMKQLGSYTGRGYIDGVENEVAAARQALARLVETPEPRHAMAAGAERMELRDDYDYPSAGTGRKIVIEAPVVLNGREIARATAEYDEVEYERRKRNEQRAKGRR